jgi:tRNA1(Val) A37 N6-methylase TrmN6
MRFPGKARMGFYPLPLSEAQRIRGFLVFPQGSSCSAIDPCVGDGVAFEAITSEAQVLRYGIELDAYRAELARKRIPGTIQGNTLEVHCSAESLGCVFLNPPYDWTLASGESDRTEQVFLNHAFRWLKPGGILILVIPAERLRECSGILATQFRDSRVYRLTEPACVRYKQIVALAVRRSRRERERMRDEDITRARLHYTSLARDPAQLPLLPEEPGAVYAVPESGPVQLVYRGLPLDEIEDLLPASPAYRQAARLLFPEPSRISGRPLLSLKSGAVGLLAVAGGLNGIFGSGPDRHISAWQLRKETDKFEETDGEGTVTIHERERFAHELALVLVTGETAILK